jgi:hypothetical protein
LNQLTHQKLTGTISLESVNAWNWNNPAINTGGINPPLTTFFIPTSDSAYAQSIATAPSRGYYGWFRYDLSNQFTFYYKLDYLELDRVSDPGGYWRHGFGFEAHLFSNWIVSARYEKASVPRPEVTGTPVLASQDGFFALIRLWI